MPVYNAFNLGGIEEGDLKISLIYKELTPTQLWKPLTDPDTTLTLTNYTQKFIDAMRSKKAEHYTNSTRSTTFGATDWDVTSNIYTITLDDNAQNNNFMEGLHEMYMKYTSYDKLPIISLPAIGNIPAGEYDITGYNVTSRTISGPVIATDGSGATSATAEFYTHRIAGSSTTEKWIQSLGDGLMLPGAELIGGLAVRDRFQRYRITANFDRVIIDGSGSGLSRGVDPGEFSNQDASTGFATDGTNGTPRTGKNTRPNVQIVFASIYTGGYTA